MYLDTEWKVGGAGGLWHRTRCGVRAGGMRPDVEWRQHGVVGEDGVGCGVGVCGTRLDVGQQQCKPVAGSGSATCNLPPSWEAAAVWHGGAWYSIPAHPACHS